MNAQKRQEKNELTIALLVLFLISSTWVYFKYLKDFDIHKVMAESPVRIEEVKTPQPTDVYVIKNFFGLVDEGRAEDALDSMASTMAQGTGYREAWRVNFNNIYYIKVRTLDEFQKELWTNSKHKFMLRLDVNLKDPAIPTVWQNGENVRYVSVVKIGDQWKISEISASQ